MSGPGAATLWSSIRSTPLFKKKLAPFPIIITLGRQAGQINLTIASPIVRPPSFGSRERETDEGWNLQYEVTPFEFGTDVPLLSPAGYVPIDYLGSRFQNGSPSNPLVCTVGFENAGSVPSSSLSPSH
jgi:lysophospholipase